MERDEFRSQIESLRGQLTTVKRLEHELRDTRTEVERLSAELDESKSRVLVLQAEAATTRASTNELEAAREQGMQLESELRDAQARLESESGHSDRIASLVQELKASRDDRDKTDTEKREIHGQLDRLRGEMGEVEHLLQRAQERHRSDQDASEQAFDQAREQWNAERAAQAEEAERKLCQERIQSEAELGAWMQRLESVESQAARERFDLNDQNARWRREAEEATLERDAALWEVEALGRERDRLAAQCAEVEYETRALKSRLGERMAEIQAELGEAERCHQAEVARLAKELERAEVRGNEALTRIVELSGHIEELQSSLDRSAESAEVERRGWGIELDSARRRGELELAGLREEIDQLLCRAEQLQCERDAALVRAASDGQERGELVAPIEQSQLASREAWQQNQAEMTRLSGELAQAREEHRSALEDNDRLIEELERLRTELDGREQAERAVRQQHERDLAGLLEEVAGERDRHIAAIEAARLQYHGEIQTAREEADRRAREVDDLRRERDVPVRRNETSDDRERKSARRDQAERRDPRIGRETLPSMGREHDREATEVLHRDLALSQLDLDGPTPAPALAMSSVVTDILVRGGVAERLPDNPRANEALNRASPGTALDVPRAELARLEAEIERDLNRGHLSTAVDLARRLVWRKAEVLGECHPDYGASLSKLAELLFRQGDVVAAKQHLDRATFVCREALGERSPQYAECLNNLATLQRHRGDEAGARRLAEEAGEILRSGARHRPIGPVQTVTCVDTSGFR